jgi:hypothetical protein
MVTFIRITQDPKKAVETKMCVYILSVIQESVPNTSLAF